MRTAQRRLRDAEEGSPPSAGNRRLRRAGWIAVSVLALAFTAVGCRSTPKEDPIMRLSAEESLAEGKALLEKGKYNQARKYLLHAFEVSPNSVGGREALLLVADSHYEQGGSTNLIQAEAKYRDFINRFPTSDRIPYVQLRIGNCLADRVEKPDRDQSITREAMKAFDELIRLYPDSDEAAEAEVRLVEMQSRLAEHEFEVGYFYFRYGLSLATIDRLEGLLEDYPEYREKDKVYFYLGLAYLRRGKPEEARTWIQNLREHYPQSEYIAEIPEIPVMPPPEGEPDPAADGSEQGPAGDGEPAEEPDR